MAFGLQAQAHNSWLELASKTTAVSMGAIAALGAGYLLYDRHVQINERMKAVEESDKALIDEVKELIVSDATLDPDIRSRLTKMHLLPRLKANYDKHTRYEISTLATIYNECNPGTDERKLAGKVLMSMLERCYAQKLKKLSCDKWKPFIYGCTAYGFGSIIKMMGNQICGLFSNN